MSPATKIFIRQHDKKAFRFHDRQAMKKGHPSRRFKGGLPAVTLPIDWAKTLSFPIYDNDAKGDCMWAAAGHGQGTFTGNVGKEILFADPAFINKYTQLSGGDNGLDEGTLIGGWKTGVTGTPAGSAPQIIVDALDIDTTDENLVAQGMYYFGGILFMLDVPDAWINAFTGNGGDVWDAPAAADQNNGHGVWQNGMDTNHRRKTQTWGSYVWITQAGMLDCDPSGFIVFSPNWFNAQGYAPNGLHITHLAALWVQAGGNTIPASVINAFPPIAPRAPTPTPTPTPTPAPSPAAVSLILSADLAAGTYQIMTPGSIAVTPDMTIREMFALLSKQH